MPMRAAGRHGENRRDAQKISAGLCERAIEMRKADIIADAYAEPAPWRLRDDGAVAGPVGVALAIALATRQIDVEHVDLVVARDDRARRIDEKRPVREAGLAGHGVGLTSRVDHQGADQQPRLRFA